jgi:hypothetical protein
VLTDSDMDFAGARGQAQSAQRNGRQAQESAAVNDTIGRHIDFRQLDILIS